MCVRARLTVYREFGSDQWQVEPPGDALRRYVVEGRAVEGCCAQCAHGACPASDRGGSKASSPVRCKCFNGSAVSRSRGGDGRADGDGAITVNRCNEGLAGRNVRQPFLKAVVEKMRVAFVDCRTCAARREAIRESVEWSRSHRCHAQVRRGKGAQIVPVLILPLRWPTSLSSDKTFEQKHNFIGKISVKSADNVLGRPQQMEGWRRPHQPASPIRLEHGFEKPR